MAGVDSLNAAPMPSAVQLIGPPLEEQKYTARKLNFNFYYQAALMDHGVSDSVRLRAGLGIAPGL